MEEETTNTIYLSDKAAVANIIRELEENRGLTTQSLRDLKCTRVLWLCVRSCNIRRHAFWRHGVSFPSHSYVLRFRLHTISAVALFYRLKEKEGKTKAFLSCAFAPSDLRMLEGQWWCQTMSFSTFYPCVTGGLEASTCKI